MSKFKKLLLSLLLLLFLISLSTIRVLSASEQNNLPSITVINLIRSKELGHEKDNLLQSLKDQWKVTSDAKVNATWLLQYSVLEDKQMVNFAKNKMPNQEFGLLFEIDRNFAQKSGVSYKGQGPSYFSDGLLLVSYDTNERKKLIDTAFKKFKNTFGYYPKTVGAWWIGADSLSYMQQKYGITAALKASDQFNLDMYSIWGTPFSIPYLASKENEGLPAVSFNQSSKVVILQWAARDPLKGYSDPLYSIQDYTSKHYDTSYVDYLASTFLKSPDDNLVFGLENGGSVDVFQKYYRTMLSIAKNLEKTHKANLSLVKDYSSNFLSQKKVFSQNNYLLYKDYKSNNQAFWINKQNYRAGIEKIGEDIYLVDLRNYSDKENEDFSLLPNSQGYLRVNEDSIVDSMTNPQSKILIATSSQELTVDAKDNVINLSAGGKQIVEFTKNKLELVQNKKTYNFTVSSADINLFEILSVIFLVYFCTFQIIRKNLRQTFFFGFLLFAALILSNSYLVNGSLYNLNLIFDKKELLILNILPVINSLSIANYIILFQISAFLLLLILHFFLFILFPKNKYKFIFYIYLLFLFFVFAHVPYFPLDRSTYLKVFVVFGFFSVFLYIICILLFFFTRLKKNLAISVGIVSLILLILGLSILISRSKYILTPFEINALEVVKNEKRDVLLVKQDTSINPIYKAIKPVLYDDYTFAEKLTETNWQTVVRPQDHVLKIADYKNKLIFVPRYLGADLSAYEEKKLKLIKIFDNTQIAIFEKI